MRIQSRHPGLRGLLLYADGELSARAMVRLEKHLAACEACSDQLRQLQSASARFATAQHQAQPGMIDIAGPRAMLKAQLAETSRLHRDSGRKAGCGIGQDSLRLARGVAYACALTVLVAVGLTASRRSGREAAPYARVRPDPAITPGLTRAVSLENLCSVDHDQVVRRVPAALEQRVLRAYGISNQSPADYEVDYLITPELGGADDLKNLWPQPHAHTVWNSYVKDQLEDRLHGKVCDGSLSLKEAQQEIAGDWIAAYKKYFHAEQPIANQMHAQLEEPSDRLPLWEP